jgi:hypothetical protein
VVTFDDVGRPTIATVDSGVGLTLSDFVVGWWLEKYGTAELQLGDSVAVAGPLEIACVAAEVAARAGAGRVLMLTSEKPSTGVGLSRWVETSELDPEDLDLEVRLSTWFKSSLGGSIFVAVDARPGHLDQFLKVLPPWGTLMLGRNASQPEGLLPVDLYRDIHRRGCNVIGLAPWQLGTKDVPWRDERHLPSLKAAAEMRRRGRVACMVSLEMSSTSISAVDLNTFV